MGAKSGLEKIKQKVAGIGQDVNGWQVATRFGDRDIQGRLDAAHGAGRNVEDAGRAADQVSGANV